jgi:agmatinase
VIFSAPFGESLTYRKGAEGGPQAIIEASQNLELFDLELKVDPSLVGIHTFASPSPEEVSSFHSMERWVYQTTGAILEGGKFPILLGGEHSVSLGSIRRAAEAFNELTVLSLDAHADMRDEYEGNRFSHACVMRRCLEFSRPVLVGVRSLSTEEYEFVSEADVLLLTAEELLNDEGALDRMVHALSPHVYLSVDLDVLDPSEMPSVGTPEPGGLSWYDVLRIIRRVAEQKEIVAADSVELSPIADNIAPDFLAAKLIYKTIAYVFFAPGSEGKDEGRRSTIA